MKHTPQQIYLAERQYFAAGLDRRMGQTESARHGLLRFIAVVWACIASLPLSRRTHATR